jgi:(E)-4-hydroxy-3-methylbut-2-enyl-diphosphate synthase
MDKWHIGDAAADFVYTATRVLPFPLPGTLRVILDAATWEREKEACTDAAAERLFVEKHFPIWNAEAYVSATNKSSLLNLVMLDGDSEQDTAHGLLKKFESDKTVVLCLSSQKKEALAQVRCAFARLEEQGLKNPVVLIVDSKWQTADEHLIHYATEAGALLLDGLGDGICLGLTEAAYHQFADAQQTVSGRRYTSPTGGGREGVEQFLNNTAFSILQATRTRISKTEYISCPSCGRTLFDLQETTAKIRAVTHHLKGVKIAIMGCIVNGPGEMADADFGYVGSGPGKITLYKGKDVVKRNVPSEVAVEELIGLLKEAGAWVERPQAALAG